MTRRDWWLGALATLVACRGRDTVTGPGLDDSGGSFDPPDRRPVVAPVPIGYSHVLRLTATTAAEVVRAGGRLVMAEPTGGGSGLPGVSPADAAGAAAVMRRVGGTLLLTGINWNDEEARTWSVQTYEDHVRRYLAAVGTAGVWFEPVSEPWVGDTDRALRFDVVGRRLWSAAGGTVIGPLPHPCTLARAEAMLQRGEPTVLDCTPVLAHRLTEADVRRLVELAVRHRAALLLYETFAHPWPSHLAGWLQAALVAATRRA